MDYYYCSLYGGIWKCYLAEPDTVLVFGIYLGVFEDGTRLAMPKKIYTTDSSSLKPGSRATEGILDKGVSGLPNYILWLDCWTMKIQERRLRPASGWDSPLHGRKAWIFGYVDFLLYNRLCVTLAPSGVYINRRV